MKILEDYKKANEAKWNGDPFPVDAFRKREAALIEAFEEAVYYVECYCTMWGESVCSRCKIEKILKEGLE